MRRFAKLALAAICVFFSASAFAEEMSGNVQFLVGQRYLGDFWKPFDEQPMFGVEVDFAPSSSPVHVAFAAIASGDKQRVSSPFYGSTGDVSVGMFELSAGFLWEPVKKGVARPYLGAGLTTMGAGIGTDWNAWGGSNTAHSFGFYGNVGIFFKVGESFNVGLDGRFVRGTKLRFSGVDGDGNYDQAALLLGFSWGK